MAKDDFLNSKEWKSYKRSKRDKSVWGVVLQKVVWRHIIPRKLRPNFELSEYNIQTLCWVCNDYKSDIYIVSFLEETPKISRNRNRKRKAQLKVRKYARKHISRKDYKSLQGIVDPKIKRV